MNYKDYETIIGLEVHSELKTKTKIYCGCSTKFGGEPNTHCCPVCTGMPGALPVLNEKVVEYAIKAGLATNCNINEVSKQDRKNYFYPDLPKAYQISQSDKPLCYEGFVDIETNGNKKRIGITRIHIEEDAGKLIHENGKTLIDYNRCGIPLIEIVTEPDIRNPLEIKDFMTKLRTLLLYTEVSDCKMNEGSIRCDLNVSVRKKGEKKLGTRTETKNINSFSFAVKAAEYEAKRQIELLEKGGKVIKETRRWDDKKNITISMRTKEEANDYRYFPAPDLMPICTSLETIEKIKNSLPELPDDRKIRYKKLGLNEYDINLIVASKKLSDYLDEACTVTSNIKGIVNFIISEIFARLNEVQKEEATIPISPLNLGELVELIGKNVISNSTAKNVFDKMWDNDENPSIIVKREGLIQISDNKKLEKMVKEVIEINPKIIKDYKEGKKSAAKALIGQIMKKTKGSANPKIVNELIIKLLEEII